MDQRYTWYVDVAKSPFGFIAAMWEILPQWVKSQQIAELMAISNAVKLAAHMKLPAIHLAANNMAAIWSIIRMTWAVGNPWRGRAL